MSVTLPDIAPVTVDDITQGSVTGTGIFDKLMATVAAQLQAEFKADRITQTDYGQVYVSALNNTLGQAIQFLLTKDQAVVQAATQAAQYEKIALEKDILELQKQELTVQVATLSAQYEKIAVEKLQLKYQNDLLLVQKAQLELQNKKLVVEKDVLLVQKDQLELQNEKLIVEKDVLLVQKDQLAAQITQLGVQSAQIQQQTLLIASQVTTDAAQRTLLNQKIVTETAQTHDNPNSNISGGYSGVVGKQNALYAAQTTGFTRDAEQKAAKLALDILATQLSTDDSMTVAKTNMHPAAIGALVQKLATGIGVTLPAA